MPYIFIGFLLLLTGCATTNERDPYESFNCKMYALNDFGDKVLLKPAARVYDAAMPQKAQERVSDFFRNLTAPFSSLNYLAQGEFVVSGKTLFGFMLNSTFGFFGLVDLATPMQLGVRQVNLADTLAAWGVGAGNYLVLPLLGPTTTRGVTGIALSFPIQDKSLLPRVVKGNAQTAAIALDLVNTRAQFLGAEKALNEIALDPYAFMREGYLQRLNARPDTVVPTLPASQRESSATDWE